MTRVGIALAAAVIAALVGAGALRAGARPARGGSPPALHSPSDQRVALAYMDPDIVLSLDVVTGRLSLSGITLGFPPGSDWRHERPDFPFETGVIGIHDPTRHELFRYVGGIPGLAAAGPVPAGAAALPAAGRLPVWAAPTQLVRDGRLALPDGRYVDITLDGHGRLTDLRWPGAHGERLRTRVRYGADTATITDPCGVSRTYRHLPGNRAFEVVPPAWRHGLGYRHFIAPVLDGARETGWVQYRATPPRHDLIAGLGAFAPGVFGGVSFDSPANGGYIDVGLTSLAPARRMENELMARGLADVSAILPTYDTAGELARLGDSLQPVFAPLLRDCHVMWGEGVDTIVIRVASTITPREVAVLDRAIQNLKAWVIVERQGASVCAVATAGARRPPSP